MVAWEDAVGESDHENQIEIQSARFEHRQRHYRAGGLAAGRSCGAIERGLYHGGEFRRVNDSAAPGERGPARKSGERGAHGPRRSRGIISGIIGIGIGVVMYARKIKAEHLQRMFEAA